MLVTAAILYNFGTGPVKGFAVSLFVGLTASLFTAVFFTRLLFDVDLHGAAEGGGHLDMIQLFPQPNYDFIGKRKWAYLLSGVVMLAALISLATQGLRYDVDFTGGTLVQVRFAQAAAQWTSIRAPSPGSASATPSSRSSASPERVHRPPAPEGGLLARTWASGSRTCWAPTRASVRSRSGGWSTWGPRWAASCSGRPSMPSWSVWSAS